jgi:hypothetical protein
MQKTGVIEWKPVTTPEPEPSTDEVGPSAPADRPAGKDEPQPAALPRTRAPPPPPPWDESTRVPTPPAVHPITIGPESRVRSPIRHGLADAHGLFSDWRISLAPATSTSALSSLLSGTASPEPRTLAPSTRAERPYEHALADSWGSALGACASGAWVAGRGIDATDLAHSVRAPPVGEAGSAAAAAGRHGLVASAAQREPGPSHALHEALPSQRAAPQARLLPNASAATAVRSGGLKRTPAPSAAAPDVGREVVHAQPTARTARAAASARTIEGGVVPETPEQIRRRWKSEDPNAALAAAPDDCTPGDTFDGALVVELAAILRTRAADGLAVDVPLDVEVIATMRAGRRPVHIDLVGAVCDAGEHPCASARLARDASPALCV